jgi:hypothetical protein
MNTLEPAEIRELGDREVIQGGFVPSEAVYASISERLSDRQNRPLLLLAKLFGRLGWEAGRCISIVHRIGFDWGSYQDHSENGTLANSHADNLVVLPGDLMDLGDGRYQLLMPTDFDMSFKKEQCVFVDRPPPVPDPRLVELIFAFELGNMMKTISGYTAALNGVASTDLKRDPDGASPQMDLVWAFRDLSAWEYLKAYKRPADPRYTGNDLTLEQALLFIPDAIARAIDVVV